MPVSALHLVPSGADLARTLDQVFPDGHDLVIVGGNDGTATSAAVRIADSEVMIGVLPLGIANDFARTLKKPNNLAEACAAIAEGKVVDIDRRGQRQAVPQRRLRGAVRDCYRRSKPTSETVHRASGVQRRHAGSVCPAQAVPSLLQF